MMVITENTTIGLAALFSIPLLALWTAMSFQVWIDSIDVGRWSIKNYRLAVSTFLLMTTLFMLDLSRLRFKWTILGVEPVTGSLMTLIIRWLWLVTIIWCTVLLYGYTIRSVIRRFRRNALRELKEVQQQDDPFLSQAEVEREKERLDRVLVRLREEWDRITVVSARIERDRPAFVPQDNVRRSRHEVP